jgi:hypothetical protein
VLQGFPFPSTPEEVTLHQLSQACVFFYSSHGYWAFPPTLLWRVFFVCVFIYSSHGNWAFPPLLWSFPPTATFTSFPTADCWACVAAPAFSSQCVVRDFPSPAFQGSGCPALFATCLFCCYCLLLSFFSLFTFGGGWSVLGAVLIWPRIICGSTACRLAHLVVHVFPSRLGTAIWWQRGSPPGFSI